MNVKISNSKTEIPWTSSSDWQEINRILKRKVGHNELLLENAFVWTRRILEKLEFLFPLMEELCLSTCPWCPDPCCLHATVWFDFKDLIFQHVAGFEPPPRQLVSNQHESCRYLGQRGCFLPRACRPFVCTWYLCPTQKALLQKHMKKEKNRIFKSIEEIKRLRKRIEASFIRVMV